MNLANHIKPVAREIQTCSECSKVFTNEKCIPIMKYNKDDSFYGKIFCSACWNSFSQGTLEHLNSKLLELSELFKNSFNCCTFCGQIMTKERYTVFYDDYECKFHQECFRLMVPRELLF